MPGGSMYDPEERQAKSDERAFQRERRLLWRNSIRVKLGMGSTSGEAIYAANNVLASFDVRFSTTKSKD